MLFCTNPACRTKNRDEATFCTRCGQPLQPMLKIPPQVGGYLVQNLLGYGGYGAVYEVAALPPSTQRYALKATFDPESIRGFERECTILQALAHDNLPRYYEWFEANGNGYLVMELVAGQNLEEILKSEGGPLPQNQVLGYALQLCDVLRYLHTQPQPILHRDIKPANIRFTPTGLLKLVDFGLFKQGSKLTNTAMRGLGTVEYAPLEQYPGAAQHTDQRSDLYSLGATLYHLLTGQTPPVVTARMATTTDPLLPANQLNPALAPHIATALNRALRPRLDERYPDVASFKAALLHADPAAPPLPPSPPPLSDTTVLRRLWQRARQAYLLKQWAQAEVLLTQVAALKPDYEEVQKLLADVQLHANQERDYAEVQAWRTADDWEQVLVMLAKLPPDFPDPQQHLLWATARQRRDQHYDAALLAAQHETWDEVLTHLEKLLAETPDDEDATELQAHAQAKWDEAERQREAAERLEREENSRRWRKAFERLEAERRQREEAERIQRLEAERLETERRQREEAERLEAERRRKEAERLEVERRRKEAERLEVERIRRLLPTMVEVPAGPFLMGSTDQQIAAAISQGANADWVKIEKPQHTLTLPRYWIGKTPITNAQFRPFVEGDGYTNQAYWTPVGWQWREQEKIVKPCYWDDAKWNGADYPVVGVSWFEALAYCRWLSQQTGLAFRLPTEAEWEKAARGPDGRLYPWGNTWEAGRCNSEEAGLKRTTLVGQYPTGASPYGALDLAGNVWEWCVTKWKKPYPYQLEDEWQPAYVEADEHRRVRGGSWYQNSIYVRGAYRLNSNPRDRINVKGLRVASHSLVPGSGS